MDGLHQSLVDENLEIARRHLRKVINFYDWNNDQPNAILIETISLRNSLRELESGQASFETYKKYLKSRKKT